MQYFREDLLGLAAATPLALLLILLPGFGLERILRQLRMSPESGAGRLCFALALGPAILPAADALLVRLSGFAPMLALHATLALLGSRAACRVARGLAGKWWILLAFFWLATAWANVDFDWNGRLYQSQYVVDTVKHAAVVGSLSAHGIPLVDPFFARPGASGYYYYFYIAPALLHWLTAPLVDSRAAFAAASFAMLLAFLGMLVVVAQKAALISKVAEPRFVGVVALLFFVSGFDVIPGLWMWLQFGHILRNLDWWSEEVRWTLSSILFEPHHMTAVIAVFVGAVLTSAATGRSLLPAAIAAGLAFATAFGCSVWVTIAAVPVLAIWWLWERVETGSTGMSALPLSGAVGMLASLTQFHDIITGRSPAGAPLAFFVRTVGPIPITGHSLAAWAARLAVLPGGYVIEFGVFALGTIAFLKSDRFAESRATAAGRLLMVSAPVALLLVTFVRSAVMYNDFGWRAVWLAQLPALLWTASVLSSRREPLRSSPAWLAALGLGVAATLWDSAGLRLPSSHYFAGFVNVRPEVDYDLRGTYEWIDRNLPSGAIVQHNPASGPRALDFGLYSDHAVAVADSDARLFGASQPEVASRIAMLRPIYERPLPFDALQARAAQAHVSAILLSSVDPLWRAKRGPPHDWTCAYRSPNSCVLLLRSLR